MALGAGGALWLEHRVRRKVQATWERVQPSALPVELARPLRDASHKVRGALEVARTEAAATHQDLRRETAVLRARPALVPRRRPEPGSGGTRLRQ